MGKAAAVLTFLMGLAALAAGCYGYVFGMLLPGPLGAWPWSMATLLDNTPVLPEEFCLHGAVVASVGVLLLAFGLAWAVLLCRHGPAVAPRRGWLVWGVALVLGACGLVASAALLRDTRAQPFTQVRVGIAEEHSKGEQDEVRKLFSLPNWEPPPPELTEAERLGVREAVNSYIGSGKRDRFTEALGRRFGSWSDAPTYGGVLDCWCWGLGPDQAVVVGHINATSKTMKQGGGPTVVDVFMRLRKAEDGRWLIDDVEMRER
jgi:hypothetical protein